MTGHLSWDCETMSRCINGGHCNDNPQCTEDRSDSVRDRETSATLENHAQRLWPPKSISLKLLPSDWCSIFTCNQFFVLILPCMSCLHTFTSQIENTKLQLKRRVALTPVMAAHVQ